MLEHAIDEHAKDLLAGRGTGDVQHAAPRVAAFEPRFGIERHAELREVGNACGRFRHELAHGALAAQPAARAKRVLRVQL